MKFLQGYRTIIVNLLVAVLGVLAAAFPGASFPSPEELGVTVDQFVGALIAVVAIINVILRAVTSTPVFRPAQPKE